MILQAALSGLLVPAGPSLDSLVEFMCQNYASLDMETMYSELRIAISLAMDTFHEQ